MKHPTERYGSRKRKKGQCKKNRLSKQYIEDLVFEKTVEYILSPDVIDTIARSVTDNFNQGLEKSNALILLEKELANVEQALAFCLLSPQVS